MFMRNSARKRNRNRQLLSDLSLTPLIDTALTLLIIFMVASPMIHRSIRISLPQGTVQEATQTNQDLTVSIDKQGAIFLNETAIKVPDLLERLKQQGAQKADTVVFVRADQAVSYGIVIELIDRIKAVGGVKYVALETTKSA